MICESCGSNTASRYINALPDDYEDSGVIREWCKGCADDDYKLHT